MRTYAHCSAIKTITLASKGNAIILILIKLVLSFFILSIGGVFLQVVEPIWQIIVTLVMLGLLTGAWKYTPNR